MLTQKITAVITALFLLASSGFGDATIRLPIETMYRTATDVVLLAPEKFSYSIADDGALVRYSFSQAKWLKGDAVNSPLEIHGYPVRIAAMMAQVLTGKATDTFLAGVAKKDAVDLLFLYRDSKGEFLYLPFGGPYLMRISQELPNIGSIYDIPPEVLKANDSFGVSCIAQLTRGSVDFEWRKAVTKLSDGLKVDGLKKELARAMESKPPQQDINIEDLAPTLAVRRIAELKSEVDVFFTQFALGLKSGNLTNLNSLLSNGGASASNVSSLKDKIGMIASSVVDVKDVKKTGNTVVAKVAISNNSQTRMFRALLDVTGTTFTLYSIDPEATN